MSTLGYALMSVLHKRPLTGYELVQRMKRPIGYYWTAVQSQIYPELTRLATEGLIESAAAHGPGPHQRMTHRLTDAGMEALAQWLTEPPAIRPPRNELALKTFALAVADPARMREIYLTEAARHQATLNAFEEQEADFINHGASDPRHCDFGSFATIQLGLEIERLYVKWCTWLAGEIDSAHGRAAGTDDG